MEDEPTYGDYLENKSLEHEAKIDEAQKANDEMSQNPLEKILALNGTVENMIIMNVIYPTDHH